MCNANDNASTLSACELLYGSVIWTTEFNLHHWHASREPALIIYSCMHHYSARIFNYQDTYNIINAAKMP